MENAAPKSMGLPGNNSLPSEHGVDAGPERGEEKGVQSRQRQEPLMLL